MDIGMRRIVVGYDGSRGAMHALRWAVAQRQPHSEITLVCVYRSEDDPTVLSRMGPGHADTAQRHRRADEVLQDGMRIARHVDPAARLHSKAVRGPTGAALASESEVSSLVVIGSRELDRFGAFLFGSVGLELTTAARGPVAVVRGPMPVEMLEGDIVVGVKDDAASQAVLAFAFEYASARNATLRPVLCKLPGLLHAPELGGESSDPVARSRLSEVLAGWREQYPSVKVEATALADFAVDGLLKESQAQRLLIVGSGSPASAARTVLGSTTQSVLHHAAVPVIVVPSS